MAGFFPKWQRRDEDKPETSPVSQKEQASHSRCKGEETMALQDQNSQGQFSTLIEKSNTVFC